MRKLSAYYIFPVTAPPLLFGIVEAEDNGTIIRVMQTGGNIRESSRLEFYPGILIPGVVFGAIEPRSPGEVCPFILEIQQKHSERTLNEIIRSLTLDAARKISGENRLGSLEEGKNPGIQLIDNIDLENMKITEKSTLKVLMVPGF